MNENSTGFDVAIIGGGPGGLSAALWCSDLGLDTIVFEKKSEFGGQLLCIYGAIRNYLGLEAENGRVLRDRFLQYVENTDVLRLAGAHVVAVDLSKKTIELADGRCYSAPAIIIATGVRRRKLEVPGEKEFHGHGILESGVHASDKVEDKKVLIVGGGDAALENALILSEKARKVIVIHRRNEFTARREFIESAKTRSNIVFLTNTLVTAIGGNPTVETVDLENVITRARSRIAADAVLIRIGVLPNSEIFRGQIALDAAGYISIDSLCATSVADVYAVGDVANPVAPTISSAAGTGATAAKAIHKKLKN